MTYIPEESKVVYQSKDGKEEKVFEDLEWLAAYRLFGFTGLSSVAISCPSLFSSDMSDLIRNMQHVIFALTPC